MRRRRRRQALSTPLPPYGWFYSVKTPFHMTAVVLRYGQPAQPQPLAMAGQTAGVGMAGMTLGGVTFDVPMGRMAGAARGSRWLARSSRVTRRT